LSLWSIVWYIHLRTGTNLRGEHLGRLRPLLTNIRLSWKQWPECIFQEFHSKTNTLAHFESSSVTKKKKFYTIDFRFTLTTGWPRPGRRKRRGRTGRMKFRKPWRTSCSRWSRPSGSRPEEKRKGFKLLTKQIRSIKMQLCLFGLIYMSNFRGRFRIRPGHLCVIQSFFDLYEVTNQREIGLMCNWAFYTWVRLCIS